MLGGSVVEVDAIDQRRERVDAIRHRSNAIEADVLGMNARTLRAFDPRSDAHWNG